MRYKQAVCGVLSGILMMTTVFTGTTMTAYGEEAKPVTPVATYDFNGTIGSGTEALITGLDAYSGDVVYGDGRSGEADDKAIQLGDYGLKLNQKNLGDQYTVSVWVKPDQTIPANMPALFLGYHSPEKWVAVSGDDSGSYKVWTREDGSSDFSWKTVATASMPVGKWSMLTLTQSGNELSTYVNGTLVGVGSATEALNGENQSIYLGVSKWDAEFTGLMDDVSLYDSALSTSDVRSLYDGKSEEEVFAEEGFTVSQTLNLLEGSSSKIKVTMSSAITSAEKTFVSEDSSIAAVDENGQVTAKQAGTTQVKTTVKVGETEKTAATTVTVTKSEGKVNEDLAVEYSMQGAASDKLQDISGHGNDATIHNPDAVTFTTENGKNIMNITDAKSYLDLPMGILNSLSDKEEFTVETTYARSANAGGTSWLFCFGSDPKATGTNYMFYCPYFSFGSGQVRAGIKNDSTEQLVTTGIQNENDTFYTVDMVFSKGAIQLYLNGVKIGDELKSGYSIEKDVVANGTKDDILGYIGKSCWAQDTNFVGKISSFKIYNKAMTDAEVQKSDPAYQQALQEKIDQDLTEQDFLGTKNPSPLEVSYDLVLPSVLEEMDLAWESSNPEVISNTGKVINGTEDTSVTLTATLTSGVLTASKSFTVIVKPFDKSELEETVKEAEKLAASPYLTLDSKMALTKALAKAENVTTQTEAATAVSAMKKAINRVSYQSEYQDPFLFLEGKEPAAKCELNKNESATLFTIPEAIQDMVMVSYSSSNPSVVKYTDGVVTGMSEGYAMVTAAVTAKSDGFVMEYKTLVTVKKAAEIDLSKVSVTTDATELANGSKSAIHVSYPEENRTADLTVSYQASGAVSVSKDGIVTAKKAGKDTVKVTVKAAGKSSTKKLTYHVGDIFGKDSVKVNHSTWLLVTGLRGTVTWSVDKENLATISEKGKFTAKKKGTVIVTAMVSGVTMKKEIKIK